MSGTGPERGRCASAASGSRALGTATAYAAAVAAFGYALMSLYWAVGGRGLVSTVGGYVEQFAHRGGPVPVLVALAATVAKVAGGLLALALVRPWGRAIRRRWLLAGATAASVLLVLYGAVNVGAGALVLSGAIHPAGRVDRTALRWHVGVWDLWFLVWGILLAVATAGYWRRTGNRNGGSPGPRIELLRARPTGKQFTHLPPLARWRASPGREAGPESGDDDLHRPDVRPVRSFRAVH